MAARRAVLVVEDDKEIRAMVGRVLTGEGYEVVEAADGRAALELLKSKAFGLVISDLMMPKMSGYDLCTEMAKNPAWAHIPILLLTAFSNPRLMPRNAKAMLTKPLPVPVLIDTVARYYGAT